MTIIRDSAREALEDVLFDGATIAVGGFGLCGNPIALIEAVRDIGTTNLTVVSNNMGLDGVSLGLLLDNRQVRKVIASYLGENRTFARQYLEGVIEVELVPQGTLAERLRAGGAGIPAFYTRTGVGTAVAEGKPHHEFDGEVFVQERAITADIALVHASGADRKGNLVYRRSARNFNPVIATAGRVTVAESERLTDEYLDPDVIVTPGIFVQRLVLAENSEKPIERLTVRPRKDSSKKGSDNVDA